MNLGCLFVLVLGVFGMWMGRGEGKEQRYSTFLQPLPPLNVSSEEWVKKMPDPLRNDFARWLESGFDVDAKNCSCSKKKTVTYIFHNGVFWFPKHSKETKLHKDQAILDYVASHLLKKYGILPTTKLFLELTSVPYQKCTCEAPSLVLATNTQRNGSGVVRRPTMYLSPRWAEDARKLFQARREWERKEEKACWRGQTTVEKGSRVRLDILILQEIWKKTNPQMAKRLDVASIGKNFLKKSKKGEHNENLTVAIQEKVNVSWFSTCKYNLHLPGHTHGGYSRALQNLLPQMTTVLLWDSPHKEYYYDWLEEGVHYLTVNETTLEKTLKWLSSHDEEAKRISENGALFYDHFLRWKNILLYWEWLILSWIRFSHTSNPSPNLRKYCTCQLSPDVVTLAQICSFCPNPPPLSLIVGGHFKVSTKLLPHQTKAKK